MKGRAFGEEETAQSSAREEVSSESAPSFTVTEAEEVLGDLASVFFLSSSNTPPKAAGADGKEADAVALPDVEARFRTFVEQIPAVIFMASLEGGIGEAYVSPQIEAMLGFTQTEWLNDPVRWYWQIHPEDRSRWSTEAAELLLTGKSLRSEYRVLARDGRTVRFHCEVMMVRDDKGHPWFIHGVAFDITELKEAETALKKAHDELEVRVQERTAELSRANEALRQARDGLEMRVLERTAELARFNKLLQDEIAERNKAEIALRASETALKSRGEELRSLTASLLSIQDEERRPIARELHDGTTQNLAALAMNLFLLMNSPEAKADPSLYKLLEESLDITEQCSRETRSLSYLLHPPLLDELGLASALKSYIQGFNKRTGIMVELELPPALNRLASEVEMALFRIIQEALANIHRHSGSPRAAIRLALNDGEARLEVEDEGCGMAPADIEKNRNRKAQFGVGIPGMRERAQQLGGHMEINFSSSGTRLMVTLPLGSNA